MKRIYPVLLILILAILAAIGSHYFEYDLDKNTLDVVNSPSYDTMDEDEPDEEDDDILDRQPKVITDIA